MLVMKIDKELSTEELIKYAKDLSEHLGEKVVILDNKVKEFFRLEEPKRFFIPTTVPTNNDFWWYNQPSCDDTQQYYTTCDCK